jgi:hypothetical protein
LPFGSVRCTGIKPSQAHLARVSSLSGPAPAGIRPVIHGPAPEGDGTRPWFPAAFRPPAFASRPSCPAWYSAPLTIGLPAPCRTMTGFPRSAHARCGRIGRPLYPGTGGAHHGPGAIPGRRLPHHNGKVLYPGTATITYPGLLPHETSVKGSRHSPARPSPHPWPPDDSGTLRLFPGLRTHAGRTRARTPGRGQALSTSLELRRQHLRHAGPPICESTRTMCDLVSHLQRQVRPPAS